MTRLLQRVFSYSFFLILAVCCPALGAGAAEIEEDENLVPGPPILSTSWRGGTVTPTGRLAVADHVAHSRGKERGTGMLLCPMPRAKANNLTVNLIKVNYGLAWDRLDIGLEIPFEDNEIERHSPQKGQWKGGWLEPTAIVRYQTLKPTKELPVSLAFDFGVLLPTGTIGDEDRCSVEHTLAFIFGGGASWMDYNQRVDLDARYVMFEAAEHNSRPANYFLANFHYAYAISRYFDVGGEGWVKVSRQNQYMGQMLDDSFTEAYAGPKVQFKIPEWNNLMLGAGVYFPIYRYYDRKMLSPDTVFQFRIGITF